MPITFIITGKIFTNQRVEVLEKGFGPNIDRKANELAQEYM